MFPELPEVCLPSMKNEDDFVEFVTTSKEELEGHLQTANDAWEERSKVMLKIVDLFADLDGVAVNLDSNTMTGLDIVFRTATKSHVYTVTLHTGTERGNGMIEYFAQKEDDKRDENQAWKLSPLSEPVHKKSRPLSAQKVFSPLSPNLTIRPYQPFR